MASLIKDLLLGAAAGAAGGAALLGMSVTLYDLTDPKDIDKEQAIEPRDPFVVLAQRVPKAGGGARTAHEQKVFEQAVANGLSAAAGAAYALAARNSTLGWLPAGMVFGALFWLVADEIVSPSLGLVGNNAKYPPEAHLRGLISHTTFGVVTAGLLAAAGVGSGAKKQ